MHATEVTLYGVGDLGFGKGDPEFLIAKAAPTLKQGDITYGHLETNFSSRYDAPQRTVAFVGGGIHPGDPPENVSGLIAAGIDVVSYASNHTLDFGEGPVLDTIEVLKKNGIAMCGVGINIDEARKPAIIERKGTKVAFLDYCSVMPNGWEATPKKLGCAPMRVSTFYETIDGQPGMPPRVLTWARKEDLEAMQEDIKKAKSLADILIVCFHWGLHHIPAVLAQYEREVSHTAIDAGADLIFGNHPHVLKGIEIYKGKVTFYNMGNFVAFWPMPGGVKKNYPLREMLSFVTDPEYPTYAWPPDSRKTLIAKCTINDKKITRVAFLPCMVNRQTQPEILPRSDIRSSEVVDYINWCSKDQGFNTKFTWEGDEVVINS